MSTSWRKEVLTVETLISFVLQMKNDKKTEK